MANLTVAPGGVVEIKAERDTSLWRKYQKQITEARKTRTNLSDTVGEGADQARHGQDDQRPDGIVQAVQLHTTWPTKKRHKTKHNKKPKFNSTLRSVRLKAIKQHFSQRVLEADSVGTALHAFFQN